MNIVDAVNRPLTYLQAQLVAREFRKDYPLMTVAYCNKMTPMSLARCVTPTYRTKNTREWEEKTRELAEKIAKAARLI